MWMFGVPVRVGEDRHVLVVGGKRGGENGAALGFLVSPNAVGRNLEAWRFVEQARVGWLMSLIAYDVDGDGDDDIVYSDRKPYEGAPPNSSGVYWLEHPDGGVEALGKRWRRHRIGANGREVMFIDVCDVDGDGGPDVLAAVKPREIHWYEPAGDVGGAWILRERIDLANREFAIGDAKAVRAADLDGDGACEIVFTCEHANPPARGVGYVDRVNGRWTMHDIGGPEGIKFDRIEAVDIDGDGDLDVMTTEERHVASAERENLGLGVVWYENPREPN
ncbi:MAG: VCBS repeat-containing protein [Planctomycetota bacterium]|nr:MAG: VCBS repeat-containing protein [Planctomycetota bacterium]